MLKHRDSIVGNRQRLLGMATEEENGGPPAAAAAAGRGVGQLNKRSSLHLVDVPEQAKLSGAEMEANRDDDDDDELGDDPRFNRVFGATAHGRSGSKKLGHRDSIVGKNPLALLSGDSKYDDDANGEEQASAAASKPAPTKPNLKSMQTKRGSLHLSEDAAVQLAAATVADTQEALPQVDQDKIQEEAELEVKQFSASAQQSAEAEASTFMNARSRLSSHRDSLQLMHKQE